MFTDTGIFLFARSACNKVVNQFSKIHATLPLHLSSPPPSVTHRYPYLIQLLERRGMPKHCHVTTSEVG